MSCNCSHCNGSGRSAIRGKIEKEDCRRCGGSGKSPDPGTEKELADFLRFKKRIETPLRIPGIGVKTGSFGFYKQ